VVVTISLIIAFPTFFEYEGISGGALPVATQLTETYWHTGRKQNTAFNERQPVLSQAP
jgi:hypothetical protein